MDLLVAYDVNTTTRKGERRLATVARICEGYGIRVQYSVFECRLSTTAYARLVADLVDAIEPQQDCVHLYRFDGPLAKARTSLGRRVPHEAGTHWTF